MIMSIHSQYKRAIQQSGKTISEVAELSGNKANSYARISNWLESPPNQFTSLDADLKALRYKVSIERLPTAEQSQNELRIDELVIMLMDESDVYAVRDSVTKALIKALVIVHRNNIQFEQDFTDLEVMMAMIRVFEHWSI
jgi:glucose-6-phosphate 1-dehydrogenase